MSEHDPTTWSYRPGDWIAIVGEHAIVVLPPTEKHRAGALWEMVDAGAGFDEALDALISSGLRQLPGFVLVSEADDVTRVVVRGAGRAIFTAGGQVVELDGSQASTWIERTLAEVSSVRIEVAEPRSATVLSTAAGLARVALIERPPVEQHVGERGEEPVEQPVEEWGEQPLGGAAPVSSYAAAAPEPEPEPEPEPAIGVVEEAPVQPLEPSWTNAADEEPTQAVPFLSEVFGDRDEPRAAEPSPVMPPPAPGAPPYGAPIPPPPPPPPPVRPGAHAATPAGPDTDGDETGDHDGHTRTGGWDPAQFDRPEPWLAGQPPAPSVTARPVARLHLSHGERVDVDRAVLVGRAPEARRFSSTDQPRLVTVPSPQQEISSTHLEIRPGSGADHGSAVVTDLGSTNGTVLVQPGLPPEDLQPGIAVQLIPGAVLDLGDGVTIRVTNP
ncbi:FHA domain-containing protein [Nocardioides panaciterrulae]|uniref:FHA domain-containing protein n=1 Tax=Nocardioides panaciterrulae TaxID=661492 RepID=A0A7Y9E3Q3_9ACTN|nr:FHA domain-containing protein [Nocardioides panaciterrulae]NYD40668.1 hypothetical protein [Nocardioides panaciterrulae]